MFCLGTMEAAVYYTPPKENCVPPDRPLGDRTFGSCTVYVKYKNKYHRFVFITSATKAGRGLPFHPCIFVCE